MKKLLGFVILNIMIMTTIGFAQELNSIKIATGKESGVYHSVAGFNIKKQAGKFQIDLIPSTGSVDNIEKLERGEVDYAILQFDVLLTKGKSLDLTVVNELYPEYVHMIVNKNSKIDSVKDLTEKNKIAIGEDGTGSMVTWRAFCDLDESYKKISTMPYGGTRALAQLKSGEIDAILITSGIGGGDIMRAEKDGGFKLISVDDWDFDNAKYKGNKIYKFEKLNSKQYPNLIPGGLFNGSVETIAINSVIVTTSKFADSQSKMFDKMFDWISAAKPNILQTINKKN